MSDEEIEQLVKLSGATEARRVGPLGLYLLKGGESASATQELMNELWETKAVIDMAPNYLSGGLTVVFNPDDPHHVNGDQWHISQPSDIDMDLPETWGEITRGSEEVVVAQTDTGIDVDHFEFLGRLFINPGEIPGNSLDDDSNGYVDDVSGWNTIADEPSGDVNDTDFGHGTWVAGSSAAVRARSSCSAVELTSPILSGRSFAWWSTPATWNALSVRAEGPLCQHSCRPE